MQRYYPRTIEKILPLASARFKVVKRWLTVAERTGLIYLLPPFDGRIGRQLVKSPKIYLIDTGLLAHLLRIDSPQTMAEHPLAEKFLRRLWLPKFSRAG